VIFQSVPRNVDAIKEQLRLVWADVLDVPTVNDDDNFVDLGADSIAATQCQQRIAATYDIDIAVAVLLTDDTTLQTLAQRIASKVTSVPPT